MRAVVGRQIFDQARPRAGKALPPTLQTVTTEMHHQSKFKPCGLQPNHRTFGTSEYAPASPSSEPSFRRSPRARSAHAARTPAPGHECTLNVAGARSPQAGGVAEARTRETQAAPGARVRVARGDTIILHCR